VLFVRQLSHTAWNWPEGNACIYVKWLERDEHCHRYFKALYSLPPFVYWPIPDSLFLICDLRPSKYLSILSRIWVVKLRIGGVKCWGVQVWQRHTVEKHKRHCFIIRKSIIISLHRHNKKADSTVNENRGLSNLLVQN